MALPIFGHRSDGRGRVRGWLSTRHALWLEGIILLGVYGAYDAGRGLAGGGRVSAVRHGRDVASVERNLGLSLERPIQAVVTHVPGLLGPFGFGYATFHLGVTAAVLFWLHRRHPGVFPWARTAFVAATFLALAGFALFPTAPPRLDGIGITDTLGLGRATSESGLLQFLYNPYAAMPSVHIAFAVLAGLSLVRYGRSRWSRFVGYVYPAYVAVEVIATGNHFVLDVMAGAATAAIAAVFASKLVTVAAPTLIGAQLRTVAPARWPKLPTPRPVPAEPARRAS